jgi:Uma2 family endonuclease
MSAKQLPGHLPLLSATEFGARHNGDYVELIAGRVQEAQMPFARHGLVCSNLSYYLNVWARTQRCGRIFTHDTFLQTKTNPDSVRGADVLYFSYERLPFTAPLNQVLTIVPEFVAEVRSPSDTWNEIFSKVDEYLAAGVQAVLVLDPDKATASVYRANIKQSIFLGPETLTIPEVLPGFTVAVGELFA